jgi:16S rRNA processing protein RimM
VTANHSHQFLAIARIIRPWGRRGEVIAEGITDFPERFSTLRRAYLENPQQQPSPVVLEEAWPHKGRIVLKLAGVESITAASHLRNRHVLIPFEQRMQLPEDSYYWSELVGCFVVLVSDHSTNIGRVTAVEPTAGVPLLHVARNVSGRRELLIPFARAICTRIDRGARLIEIDPPEDLLNLNDDPGRPPDEVA